MSARMWWLVLINTAVIVIPVLIVSFVLHALGVPISVSPIVCVMTGFLMNFIWDRSIEPWIKRKEGR